MRRWLLAAPIALTALVAASPSEAGQSCTSHRSVCEAACTPAHVARYHFGDVDRCEASCEPRRQQCLRTGIWVDLERRSTGWWEAATPF
ncbi:hypothetical protein [Enterovirga sp.]|jgi:hypothetical protein|uniref:hypothetical protein n=1 Tax=Enterovirga sp. TaxID=2026350 RepID=UPI00262071CB|nr:hypothetical protein [Enterovirga sp.]MDB5590266.1 hypothetical protein [Enterovirga sp.]